MRSLAPQRSALSLPRVAAQRSTCDRHHRRVPCAAQVAPPAAPATSERLAEAALSDATADIAGIPRAEWLRLQAPARYLGNEWGAVHKAWTGDGGSPRVRFVLAYPEVYEVGASNLGHIVLYTVLNAQEELLCDRSYLPAPDCQAMLATHAVPLFAVESRRPLRDFHLVGLSLAYELSCTNLLQKLHLAGIPLSWQERAAADRARTGGAPSCDAPGEQAFDVDGGSLPLCFAGGPTATSNPEPYADFCDFFALGDGEDCLPEIGACVAAAQRQGLSRRGTLLKLAREVEGVYVPQFYDAPPGWGGAVFANVEGLPPRIRRRVASPDPSQQIGLVPFVETVHDRLTIEIRRGCTRGCRFCQPGMLTRPARDVAPEDVIAAVQEGVKKTGYTDFSLLSLSCSDYLALPAVGIELRNKLADQNISLSLPSQRVDRFDENIARLMGGAQSQPSITFAPEAGTQRLRDIINKGLSNAELRRGVVTAFDQGWRKVKLYFMIGLPGETDEDVLGILDTILFLQRECRGRAGKGKLSITATISNFTPKPHTPFQWHSVSTAEFERKQDLLRKALRKSTPRGRSGEAPDVRLNYTSVRISAMEDFLGRGDRRLCAVVRAAWQRGACNEAWWEGSDASFAAWDGAIQEAGMSWKYRSVAAGEWDVLEAVGDERFRGQGGGGKGRVDRGALADSRLDAPLPWDHVDTGVSRAWLKADLQRALEAVTVPDCSHSVCSECGVCDDGEHFGQNVIAPPPPVPEFTADDHLPATAKAQRLRLRYARRGDVVCVGHLDMMRLFERAARRAELPVSQDESPFHSRPRIVTALALALGATSDGELIELTMARRVAPAEALAALAAQMPEGITLSVAGEYPLRAESGKALTLGAAVSGAEWLLHLAPVAPAEGEAAAPSREDYGRWVDELLAMPAFPWDKRTKGGARKTIDLRPALQSLALASQQDAARLCRTDGPTAGSLPPGSIALRFRGAAGVDEMGNGLLGPDYLLGMLEQVSGLTLEALHVHRICIDTSDTACTEEQAEREAAVVAATVVIAERKRELEKAARQRWEAELVRTRALALGRTLSLSRGLEV